MSRGQMRWQPHWRKIPYGVVRQVRDAFGNGAGASAPCPPPPRSTLLATFGQTQLHFLRLCIEIRNKVTAVHIAVQSRQKRNGAELGFSSRYSKCAETDVQSRKKCNSQIDRPVRAARSRPHAPRCRCPLAAGPGQPPAEPAPDASREAVFLPTRRDQFLHRRAALPCGTNPARPLESDIRRDRADARHRLRGRRPAVAGHVPARRSAGPNRRRPVPDAPGPIPPACDHTLY